MSGASHHDHGHLHAHGALTTRAALASVAMALFLLLLKLYASLQTGSVALLGSLADTALDLVASLVTLFGVRVAAQPADFDHRFGHGKAEAIAALFQTMLIVVSAVGIAWRAGDRLLKPVAPVEMELGIGVSLVAILTTLGLVAYQRLIVRRTRSLAIHTDQLHYQSDLLLNSAVIVALVLERVGVSGADAIFGLLIAAYLAWGAAKSARAAIDMLMDREWPDAKRQKLLAVASGHPKVHGIHEIRTRTSGATDFIQFHMWVDAGMTVRDAHRIVDEVEAKVASAFPGAEILIHVDPAGHIDRSEQNFDQPLTEPNHSHDQ